MYHNYAKKTEKEKKVATRASAIARSKLKTITLLQRSLCVCYNVLTLVLHLLQLGILFYSPWAL